MDALLRVGMPSSYSKHGLSSCLNLTQVRAANARSSAGWSYLACTEVVHPIGSNNVSDFFPPESWSAEALRASCEPKWGVVPRPRRIPEAFGLYDLESFKRAHTRILFTYGLSDPWHTLGIGLTNLTAMLPVLTIPEGSHCADMHSASVHDTRAMIKARIRAAEIIRAWLTGVLRTTS